MLKKWVEVLWQILNTQIFINKDITRGNIGVFFEFQIKPKLISEKAYNKYINLIKKIIKKVIPIPELNLKGIIKPF